MAKSFKIKSHEQLEALTLPIRTEIVEIIAFLGPCSIGDLARIIGRKRPVLHFHVGKLLKAGLLLEAGDRGEGVRRETLYRTPGAPFYVIYDGNDPLNVEMTTRYSKNILSRATRLLADAFRSGAIRTNGALRDTYATQVTAWLSDSQLTRVNRLIDELESLLEPSQDTEGKRLYNLTLGLAPLHPEGGAES